MCSEAGDTQGVVLLPGTVCLASLHVVRKELSGSHFCQVSLGLATWAAGLGGVPPAHPAPRALCLGGALVLIGLLS